MSPQWTNTHGCSLNTLNPLNLTSARFLIWLHVQGSRAPVLAVDPPPQPPSLDIKMTLTWGLPLSHSPQSGKLYLANLGLPRNVYKVTSRLVL